MIIGIVLAVFLGQDAVVESELQSLELRVIALGTNGLLVVDRGARDGVQVGDSLWLAPKGAALVQARVVEVGARDSQVELMLPGGLPAPGTKGEIWVRAVVEDSPVEPEPGAYEGAIGVDEAVERDVPRWSRKDDGWDASEHLLSRVRSERPEDRRMVVHGRIYSAIGGASNLDLDRGHGYLRSGFDVNASNPFGWGGRMNVDAELDLRSDFVPSEEGRDRAPTRLRLDELSYAIGGDRYSPLGHEFGRFWLGTTPELGRIDGYEFTQRLENGMSLGASAGFLVEDGFNASTGHELAFNGFVRWVPDQREKISVTGAFQQSYYNGNSDRQLLFLRATAAPGSGLGPWSLHSALWYDLYSSEDQFENSGAELSRIWLQGWREYESNVLGRRDDLALHYRHEGFVQRLVVELPPLYAAGLVNEKNDRLGINGDVWITGEQKLFYSGGIWEDDQESGADVEAGIGFEGGLLGARLEPGSHADLRLFMSAGRSSTSLGIGAGFGRALERHEDGSTSIGWDVSYEFLHHDRYGFTVGVDDSIQHRVRYAADFGGLGHLQNWRLAGHVDGLVGGDDVGLVTGFYLTRSF